MHLRGFCTVLKSKSTHGLRDVPEYAGGRALLSGFLLLKAPAS